MIYLGWSVSVILDDMKETGSPKLLFENLDLTPIHLTLWTDLHTQGPGRPVEYQPKWDLRALMLRQLEQIPYVKDLVKRLRRNAYRARNEKNRSSRIRLHRNALINHTFKKKHLSYATTHTTK